MNSYVDKELGRMYLAESRRNISWHSFGVIINPKKYGKNHPEYFPLVRGKRLSKPNKQLCDWSPCVSNPEVQKLFVQHILKNYGKGSSDGVELSVNDGAGNHCECTGCTAWDDPGEKEKGFYSNRYFTFYKKILDEARKVNPEVKGIILLYSDATSKVPAKVDIHPGLIGMSTVEATVREFAQKGMKQLGFWHHQLDQWYPLPRHYPHAMAEKLRDLHRIGVREYFGEVYMIGAANSPKQYILGRLLWDLKSDPDKVLAEYCDKAFGPKAGPHVKKYYDLWEKICIREAEANKGKPRESVRSHGAEKFIGLRHGDVEAMEECLRLAAKSPMTALEKQRLEIIANYFAYIRCLAENYLDAVTLRNDNTLTLEKINAIYTRTLARDAAFEKMWKNLISQDKIGLYRYVLGAHRRQRVNPIYGLYRTAIKAYVYGSAEIALQGLQKRACASMKRKERLQYWNGAFKKYPALMPVTTMIGNNSAGTLKNYIQNGDFKKGTPGNPKVKGDHPKLENWYFYEQIGDVRSDAYKNYWKLVKPKYGSYQLGFGMGKYPEIRQYIYLPAGIYRLSFQLMGVNTMNFNLYEIPNLTKEAFSDINTLRSFKVKSPAIFSYNHLPAPKTQAVAQTLIIEKEAWYSLFIATPSRRPHSWDRLMNIKLEKLTDLK
jgi:hypothetical protein